jgi:hypothetical protein
MPSLTAKAMGAMMGFAMKKIFKGLAFLLKRFGLLDHLKSLVPSRFKAKGVEVEPQPIKQKGPELEVEPEPPTQRRVEVEEPPTLRKREVEPEPVTQRRPEIEEEPTTQRRPEIEEEPTTQRRPEVEEEPTTQRRPEVEEEPTTQRRPEVEDEPTTQRRPETDPALPPDEPGALPGEIRRQRGVVRYEGSPEFVDKAEQRMNNMKQTPEGQRLVDSLNEKGQPVLITEGEPYGCIPHDPPGYEFPDGHLDPSGEPHTYPGRENPINGKPGTPIGSTVGFNPDKGLGPGHPPEAVLAHELGHAENYASGTNKELHPTPEGDHRYSNLEEKQVITGPEKRYREQAGLPGSDSHHR